MFRAKTYDTKRGTGLFTVNLSYFEIHWFWILFITYNLGENSIVSGKIMYQNKACLYAKFIYQMIRKWKNVNFIRC